MITNPEYLSKDRLKQELKKHGISFSPNENKDYYVQLYREEVMQGKEPEGGRSEFSSDEEFGKQSSRPSKKQTKNTPAKSKRAAAPKLDTYLPQVEKLSDKELSEQLQGYGENVGPITATTRRVYERKLAKLMAAEGATVPPPVVASSSYEKVDHETTNESFIGEWSDDEEEEESEAEEVGSAPPPQKRVVTQSSRTRKQYTETIHVSSKGAKDSNIRQRPSKPPSSSTPLKPSKPTRSGASSSTKRSSSSSAGPSCSNIWSLICSILLIVLMFAIAFLVYEHYTCPEEQESLIISGWKKAGVLVVEMREWILKELPAEGPGAGEPNAKEESPKGKAGGTERKGTKANQRPKKTPESKSTEA